MLCHMFMRKICNYFKFILWSKKFVCDTFSLPDVDVLIVMVTNEAQAESILYGEFGAVSGMQNLFQYTISIW